MMKRSESNSKLRYPMNMGVYDAHGPVARQSVDISTEIPLSVECQDQDGGTNMAVISHSEAELPAGILGDKTGLADTLEDPAAAQPNFNMKIAAYVLGDKT